MISVQKAVLPGTFVGILFLIFFTNTIAGSRMAVVPRPIQEVIQPAPVTQSGLGTGTVSDDTQSAEAEIASPGCSISSSFPESIQQWCGLISQYASEQNLEPNLIAAVMLQESGGDPNAYSKSGAVGLMQVMPKDGLAKNFQCINGPCFASRPSMDELYDPDFNVSYGTHMLANLIERYGNVRDALKAYGPKDMDYRYADIILGILDTHDG